MDASEPDDGRRSDLLAAWAVLEQRRSAYDSMVWQTPALGLTAQAFLLTLALGPGTSAVGRCLASLLSIVLSIMVIQLMAKHRRGEVTEALHLERLEAELGLEQLLGIAPHAPLDARIAALNRALPRVPRTAWPSAFWGQSSVRLWILGQWVIAGVAALVVALVLLGHNSLLS